MTYYLIRSHRMGDEFPVTLVVTDKRRARDALRELEADEKILHAEMIERGSRRKGNA